MLRECDVSIIVSGSPDVCERMTRSEVQRVEVQKEATDKLLWRP